MKSDLFLVLSKLNVPYEIMEKVYMMQIPTIKNQLKTELLQKQKLFFRIDTRIYYIKRIQKLIIKYRIKEKIKYYKNMNATINL